MSEPLRPAKPRDRLDGKARTQRCSELVPKGGLPEQALVMVESYSL